MRGAVLVVLAMVVAACAASLKPTFNVRSVTIEELLDEHPDLKASLSAKIANPSDASDNPSSTPSTITPTSTSSTTTPAPQADSPTAPTAATTPTGRGARGRQPGTRRRRPVGETSARFGGKSTGHRLRVVPTQEPIQRNARVFPKAQ